LGCFCQSELGFGHNEVIELDGHIRFFEGAHHQADIAHRKGGIGGRGKHLTVGIQGQRGTVAVGAQAVGGRARFDSRGRLHLVGAQVTEVAFHILADRLISVAGNQKEIEVVVILITTDNAEVVVLGAARLGSIHSDTDIIEVLAGVRPYILLGGDGLHQVLAVAILGRLIGI